MRCINNFSIVSETFRLEILRRKTGALKTKQNLTNTKHGFSHWREQYVDIDRYYE